MNPETSGFCPNFRYIVELSNVNIVGFIVVLKKQLLGNSHIVLYSTEYIARTHQALFSLPW